MIAAAERVDLESRVGAILPLRTVRELDLRDRALARQVDDDVLAGRDPRVIDRAHGGAVVEVHGHRAQLDEVVHADELEPLGAGVVNVDEVVAVARIGADLDEWRGARGARGREQEGGGE